jgi:hypothetical protein
MHLLPSYLANLSKKLLFKLYRYIRKKKYAFIFYSLKKILFFYKYQFNIGKNQLEK